MKALIYKELKLVTLPLTFLFALFTILIFIPNYPVEVSFLYFFMPFQVIFASANGNKDIEFTSILPITKKQIVMSKLFVILLYEFATIFCGLIFSIIRNNISFYNDFTVGIYPNAVLFGVVLMSYSLYNFIFLRGFFKTGYKWGIPHLYGILIFFIAFVILITPIYILNNFNFNLMNLDSENRIYRIIFFGISILIFTLINYLAYNSSKKRFIGADL